MWPLARPEVHQASAFHGEIVFQKSHKIADHTLLMHLFWKVLPVTSHLED